MKTMTSKERLETVIAGGIPDRVPATIHQWQGYHYRNIMKTADDLEAFLAVGLDAVIYPWGCVKTVPNPDWVSSHTEKRVDDEMTEIEGRIITPDGVLTGKAMRSAYTTSATEHAFKRPEDIYIIDKYLPVPELDVEAVLALKARLGDNGIMRCFTNGPQGSPWQDACCFYGTEEMIYRSYDDPAWTHEFLEILLRKKMEFYKKNLTPLKGVFGMIETGGGAASNNVISPAMFEEFCLPYDIRQHELIHKLDANIAISYHTCGGMMKLLDLIPRNGCDFSETLSPPGCGGDIHDHRDEAEVKRTLGAKVKLMGGLNQSEILEKGTREQIYAEVERCFKGYGANGGYIMMPSDHFFHAPKVNLEHYARAVQEICRY
jgi:hypothetical protein